MFYLYLIITVVHLLLQFMEIDSLQLLISYLSVATLLLAFKHTTSVYRWSGTVFLLLGLIMYISLSPKPDSFSLFGRMVFVLAFLFVLPFINLIIRLGRYDQSLSRLIKSRAEDLLGVYRYSGIATFSLAMFLNIATVAVMYNTTYSMMGQYGADKQQKLFAKVIMRSFALGLVWSPLEPVLATTIDQTGSSYLSVFPILLLGSVLFILIDWIIFKRSLSHLRLTKQADVIFRDIDKKRLLNFGSGVICIIAVVLSADLLFESNLITILTLLIPVLSSVWALLLRKGQKFIGLARLTALKNTTKLHNYFFMFIAAGFFVEVVKATSLFSYLSLQLQWVYYHWPLGFFYLVIAAFILILAVCGFHPIIILTLVMPFLIPYTEIHPWGLSIVLSATLLASVPISPYSVSQAVLASLIQVNPYRITLWNFRFVLGYVLFFVIIAAIVGF